MRFSGPATALLALIFALPAAAAPSAEGLDAAAQAQFLQAISGPSAIRFAPAPRPMGSVQSESLVDIRAPQAGAAAALSLVRSVDLAGLLNRHLKTSLHYTLGGVSVWVSGAFDRQQNAYVSILVDGQAPRFFNVSQLLSSPRFLDIGSARYSLSLAPDLFDQLSSEIVLSNVANRHDQTRIQLGDMLDAIEAAGETVVLGAQTYHCFYYDDVSGGTRSFAFIMTDAGGGYHVFLIPAEIVPTEQPATFKMYHDQIMGLRQNGQTLRIYQ